MTIAIQATRATFPGNDVAFQFDVGFPVQRASDVVAIRRDAAGVETELELNVDFVVEGEGDADGCVVRLLAGPLSSGHDLVIERRVAPIQDTDFTVQGAFFPDTHEAAFDRLVMMIQQLVADQVRALVLGVTDVDGAGAYRAKGNRIRDLGAPINGGDAVTRSFVESLVTSILSGGGSFVPLPFTHVASGAITYPITGATLADPSCYLVAIDGVVQSPTDDYAIDLVLQRIIFTVAPPVGSKILIIVFGYARAVTDLPSPPRYTEATKPSPSAAWLGKYIRVRDPGTIERIQTCLEGVVDGTYAWVDAVLGAP